MRLKKNLNKDLNHKRGIYFIVAIALILALIYIALEWKTEDDNGGYETGGIPDKEIIKKDTTVVLETQAK